MQRKLRANIRAKARNLTEEHRALGSVWYVEAATFAQDLAESTGSGFNECAAIIAALSPRTSWKLNLKAAAACAFYEPKPAGVITRNWHSAGAIRDGLGPEDVLRGPKVFAFWRNIVGDKERVTIDVWALRTAGYEKSHLTPREYVEIERAFVAVAAEHNMAPRDFQAALWVLERGSHK
jgi:hypothetical protein